MTEVDEEALLKIKNKVIVSLNEARDLVRGIRIIADDLQELSEKK